MQRLPAPGSPISLRKSLPEADIPGDDLLVQACCAEARRVEAGAVFVALPGVPGEGIAEAVRRGCAAVLAERPVEGLRVPVYRVADAREAYGRLCHALAGHPSRRLKVLGVAGTHGKTTASCLIAGILHAAGHRIGVVNGLGCLDGRDVSAQPGGPAADDLAGLLAQMVENGCSHAVMAVSAKDLEERRVAGIEFDAACITCLGEDRSADGGLLERLAGDGFGVMNADDAVSADLLARLDGPVLTVGIRSAAEITAVVLERSASQQTFLLVAGSEIIPVSTRMIGLHHVSNCLLAAAAGLAYGVDLPTVARGLQSVDHVPGRLERIECGQSFAVFLDHARDSETLAAALAGLRGVTAGRLICVFSAAGTEDAAAHIERGRAAGAGADLAIVTSAGRRKRDPRIVIDALSEGARRGAAEGEMVPGRAKAIAAALGRAREGDCVLIAGGDDRDFVSQWLRRQPALSE